MLLEETDETASAAATSMSHKSPLLGAILDACETLKALQASSSAAGGGPSTAAATTAAAGGNGGNQRHAFSGEALAGARGLIFMRTDKIGFGVSVTQGYGLLLARRGPASWSPPLPLKIDGCSLGAVAGYAEQRTLLALATDGEVRELCSGGGGKGSGKGGSNNKNNNNNKGRRVKVGLDLTLGMGKRLNQSASVDAKAAAGGSRGGGGERAASASASAAPSAPAAATTTRAFTLSKGYIVDVSLRGLFVEPDADDLARAYGEGITPDDVLFGGAEGGCEGEGGGGAGAGLVTAPAETALLYNGLRALEEGAVVGKA